MSNKGIGIPDDHLKIYKIDPKIDILSIGCVMLRNLLQIDLLKIDVVEKSVVPKRELHLKCPMCDEKFVDFEKMRPHLIRGHKISFFDLPKILSTVEKIPCKNRLNRV